MRLTATERLAAARTALMRAESRTGLADRTSRDIRRIAARTPASSRRGAHRSDPRLAPGADSVGALTITGSTSVLLAAAARRQGSHGWCAVVDAEGIGWCAASECGLALDRVLVVRIAEVAPRALLAVIGALLDGVDVLLLSSRCSIALRVRDHRSLTARARERGALILTPAPWEGARALDAMPQSAPQRDERGARLPEVLPLRPRLSAGAAPLPPAPIAREMPEGHLHRLSWLLRESVGAGPSRSLHLDATGVDLRDVGAEPWSDSATAPGVGA